MKKMSESEEYQCVKAKKRKPFLDAHDLLAPRQDCMTNH